MFTDLRTDGRVYGGVYGGERSFGHLQTSPHQQNGFGVSSCGYVDNRIVSMGTKRPGRDVRLSRCPDCGGWRYEGTCRTCRPHLRAVGE